MGHPSMGWPTSLSLLPPGLELDVLDGDVVDGEVEVVDCTHDGGVEAVGDDPGASNLLV